MNLIKDQPIPKDRETRGRGRIRFPEFLKLRIAPDGLTSDCLIYPDTPYNRKGLRTAVMNCNYGKGVWKGRTLRFRCEIISGEPSIVIQRVK
jgi:hypothetical protein